MSKNKSASKFDRELNKIISEVNLFSGFDFSDDESDCSDIIMRLEKNNMVLDGDECIKHSDQDSIILWVPDENPYKRGNNEVTSAFEYEQRGKSISTANDNSSSRNKKACSECGKPTTGYSFLDKHVTMCGVCNHKNRNSFYDCMKAAGI